MAFIVKLGKIIFGISFLLQISLFGQLKLPKLISDGMVLQRNTDVKIWGWYSPGEQVSVDFIDATYNCITDSNGKWSIQLPRLKAGGPYDMRITASNTIILHDILVGEVWVCSGQSNMELTMQRVSPIYMDEIAASENQFIRYFEVPDKYNFNTPQTDLSSGKWERTNPESILHFSAVSYFFGKELYEKYHVPIGLINSALGGSPISAWISEESLKEFPDYFDEAQKFKDSTLIRKIIDEDQQRIAGWYNRLKKNDKGYAEPDMPWYSMDFSPTDWSTMNIPGYWAEENPGVVNGVVWFRKEIKIPASMAGKKAKLNLGRIIDADSVYVNGVFVGTTSYQYPPRRYTIPEGILKDGRNVIVVRVISNIGRGGFEFDKPYEIVIGMDTLNLTGEWKYKLGTEMQPLQSQTFIRWKPLGLYNAMIAPLLNYSIKGVIWYQGESDAGRPLEYRKTFPALIKDWRTNWGQGDFPFLFVQLPNFMEAKPEPSVSNWALLREAQFQTLSVPNTGMAVAIDIGEWNDIHPLDKLDVGKRLVLAAENIAYGEKGIVYSGPLYDSIKIDGNKVVLSFTNTGSGLVAKGSGKLDGFAICGPDKKFVRAQAIIKDNKIVVWNDKVSNPVAVRYAWADNPDKANLYNKEGLPASPFRTDEFN